MEYRLLGPVEVEREGRVVPLGGPKQRAVLAILLLRRGTSVSSDVLIDELWGESAPATARNALQGYVFQLRKVLEPEVERGQPYRILESDGAGYRLEIAPGELDVERFERLTAEGRQLVQTSPAAAAARFDEALSLWCGLPLAEFAFEPFAAPYIERLEEERLATLEERIELRLELGHHARVVGELEELCRAYPLRERPHALLMLALYRSGRQSEALEVYGLLRSRLDDELGLEPGTELQALQRRILQQDETLDAERPSHRRLPEGTVTFLFTDIEGSTQLLHELGAEAYGATLTEHRRVLRGVFAAHQGVEVDTQGDALFVAFRRAQDALIAAAEGQAALGQGSVRVRIGIHTGEPLVTEEGYVGVDVHRAARIMSAGHGGQVLVSETTHRLVEGQIELRDLGPHRLKDMTAPQRLYQLGDGDFPPLRSLNQTNLPGQPTPLVGRAAELAELEELLSRGDVRLVTLTGPGGNGKTRLALQAAAEAVERMPDGVFWVSLAAVPSHELVLPAVARALDVREVPGEPLELTLFTFLSSRRLLLLLDNFEHVLEARSLLAELLAGCPEMRLLVTSRTTLTLAAEYVYEVPPLREDEAVDLFVERARQAGVEVVASAAVAAICGRLDRLPLAIELAAARARLLEPQALLERLERRLPLLKGGAPDLPARQQTLHATIAWSHDLLDEEERAAFRRLSVFAGSFTLESAEAVANADLWTVESLVAKSLVRRWGSGRLGLLETIREYATEQLEQTGEAEQLRDSHAEHYLQLTLALEPHLSAGDRQNASVNQLAAELDNLRASLLHFERTQNGEHLLQLATAVWRFWMARGYFGAGRRWIERGLAAAEQPPEALRAHALEGLGVLNILQGNLAEGEGQTSEALKLFRGQGDVRGTAESLSNLGGAAIGSGAFGRAEALLGEAAELARAADEWHVVAVTASNLAEVAVGRQDYDRAVELLEEAERVFEQLGDTGRMAMSTMTRGLILVRQGRIGDATRSFAAALAAADALPQLDFAALGLVGVAAIVNHDEDGALAAQLVGAADSFVEVVGVSWTTQTPGDRAMREQVLAIARERLGDSLFEAAYAAGRGLTFDQAVAKALAAVDQRQSF